jgi:hypothetical protein
MLKSAKNYINKYKKRPLQYDKNKINKKLGQWLSQQSNKYKNRIQCMKNVKIIEKWEQFIIKYKDYFPNNSEILKKTFLKSTTIKPKEPEKQKESDNNKQKRTLSEYQELSKKMTTQKSETTKKMFKTMPELWHQYHDNRDFSFKGYDKQDEIPVNKIITYLEAKANKKLKILDLGCGRNLIKKHFENNKNLEIIGYDHISYNNSVACDISKLPDNDESINICIYSQSLMGTNWKEYIDEGFRVLIYNGEMIISESIERFETIKNYIDGLGYIIKACHNEKSNRWFYLHITNDIKI